MRAQVVQHFDPEGQRLNTLKMQTRPFHLWCVGSAKDRRAAALASAAKDASSEDGEAVGLLKH